jgi:hypothetical protein
MRRSWLISSSLVLRLADLSEDEAGLHHRTQVLEAGSGISDTWSSTERYRRRCHEQDARGYQ